MTDKEKILAEIESELSLCAKDNPFDEGRWTALNHLKLFSECLSKEPESEDLEEAIEQSFIYHENRGDDSRSDEQIETTYRYGFESGAEWKERQFEKNRLKHCNSITNEQAELEQCFIDQHLDKYNRMPTFIDAIEYGMRLQKEQMMSNATEAYIRRNRCTNKNVLNGLDVSCDAVQKFTDGGRVKIIIVKEE